MTHDFDRRNICTFVLDAANQLKGLTTLQGRLEEAGPLYGQALVILQARLPAYHSNITTLKKNIASLPSRPTEQN
jgi:hypothetical protein